MSTEWSGTIHFNTDMRYLNSIIREHVIVHPPPWSMNTLLQNFITRTGRKIKIIIYHNSRNCSIVESSISHHVLQTTVGAFQLHRLSSSVPQPTPLFPPYLTASTSVTDRRRRATSNRAHDTVDDRQFDGYPSNRATNISSSNTTQMCAICLAHISLNELEVLPCAHSYHRRCIQRWTMQSQTCPVCRTSIINT